MKIMITGAGGFLGSRLVSYYANKKCADLQEHGESKYEVWGVKHAELDFADEAQAAKAVRVFQPDVVIHCGAISDVGTCEKNPELSYTVNVEGTRFLARAAKQVDAKFVYCSSDQVYLGKAFDRTEDLEAEKQRTDFLLPHQECELLFPQPVYGRHKLLAEQLCLEEQPNSVILRLTWMYDAVTEEEYAKGRRNLATMAEEALRAGQVLSFSETDYRGVTDVRKVVEQMEKAWKLPAGIYNYGSSNDTNMYETMQRVFAAFGRPELVRKAAGGNLRNLTMDTKKAQEAGISFLDSADGLAAFLREKGIVR